MTQVVAPKMQPVVSILLSVYNGAQFLPGQLGSFQQQAGVQWRLYWRDDGSTDNSVAIMRAFAAQCQSGQCIEVQDDCGRVGVCRAYFQLLNSVADATFVAFADQDDVWLSDKLLRACTSLKDDPRPRLYCARQYIVDTDLANARLSPLLPDGARLSLENSVTQNIAVGHTLVLNSAAVRQIKAIPFPDDILHDWWSYLVVTAVGGKVITDNTPVSLYRQHSANVIGAAASSWTRGRRALQRGASTFMQKFVTNITALRAINSAPRILGGAIESQVIVPKASQHFLDDVSSVLKTSAVSRFMFLVTHPKMRRQGTLEHAVFCLWFILYSDSRSR